MTHAIYQTKMRMAGPSITTRGGGAARRQGFLKDGTGEVEIIPSAKMSKSKKNVVDPSRSSQQYGADTARWFVLSDSPPERDVEWTASGAEAAFKAPWPGLAHRGRRWPRPKTARTGEDDALLREMHKAIHDVTAGSRASASTPRWPSSMPLPTRSRNPRPGARRSARRRTLAQLMSPMTPHLAEESVASAGRRGAGRRSALAGGRPGDAGRGHVTLPIQINGKRRDEISVPKDMDKAEVEKLALADRMV